MRPTTVKRLFAVAGNTCAFPGCVTRLVLQDVIVGEICHIRAREAGGPRYDPEYPDRDAFENQILMCGVHHKVIDTKPNEYPVELLEDMKRRHEERFAQPSDQALQELMINLNDGSLVTSYQQVGGQTAHQITNVYHEPPSSPPVSLEPTIDVVLRSVDRDAGIDYYDFSVSLYNDGEMAVREYRVDVEIPRIHMDTGTTYSAEVNSRASGRRLFRHTQANIAGRVIYPGDTEQVFKLSFTVTRDQYVSGVDEVIKVSVFAQEKRLSATDYQIAPHLNKERMSQVLSK